MAAAVWCGRPPRFGDRPLRWDRVEWGRSQWVPRRVSARAGLRVAGAAAEKIIVQHRSDEGGLCSCLAIIHPMLKVRDTTSLPVRAPPRRRTAQGRFAGQTDEGEAAMLMTLLVAGWTALGNSCNSGKLPEKWAECYQAIQKDIHQAKFW